MLEACLEYSRKMVEARKRNNHNSIPVDTYEQDLKMAQQVGAVLEVEMLLKKIKITIDEKQNK